MMFSVFHFVVVVSRGRSLRGRFVARGNPETNKAFVFAFAVVVCITERQLNVSREGRPQSQLVGSVAPTVRLRIGWHFYVTLKSNNL
jgi:hypothetical protein